MNFKTKILNQTMLVLCVKHINSRHNGSSSPVVKTSAKSNFVFKHSDRIYILEQNVKVSSSKFNRTYFTHKSLRENTTQSMEAYCIHLKKKIIEELIISELQDNFSWKKMFCSCILNL